MADVMEVKAHPVEVKATPATVGVSSSEAKQGSICCGFCCDYRRAVCVLSIIGIVFYGTQFVMALLSTSWLAATAAETDDEMEVVVVGAAAITGIFTVVVGLNVLFQIFLLFAALKYNVCMLGTVATWQLIVLGTTLWDIYEDPDASFVGSAIFAIIIQGLFIYPVVGLLLEIKNGIMSAETYPREAHSCCCEPKV